MATKKNNINDKVSAFFQGFAEIDGEVNFHFSDAILYDKLPVIRTGSLALDDALSSGGYPKGRVTHLYGTAGCGKTMLAMLAIKQAQKEDPKARQVFIDAEQTYSQDWATQLGVNPKRVVVIDGELAANGRRCFTMLLGEPKEDAKTHVYKGKKVEGLLDKIASGELNFNLIVLDSLGQLIPPGEDTAPVGKMNFGLMARFLTKELKRLVLEVNRANIPFIIINHKKDSMDPYGPDHTFSGGNTLHHTLSCNVYLQMSASKDKLILDDNGNKVGGTVFATVEKSKFGPYPRKCEFVVDFREGIVNIEEELFELATRYNVIKRPTTQTNEYGDIKWVGRQKAIDAIKEDKKLFENLIVDIDKARDSERAKKKEEQAAVINQLDEEEDQPA